MLALSALVPLALFGWTMWSSHAQEMEDAAATAVRTVTALNEHVIKVLDTHEIVLAELDYLIKDRPWDEIARDEELRGLMDHFLWNMDQLLAVSLIDGEGRIRLTTIRSSPPNFSVADREYFIAQRERDAGTFISAPYVGRNISSSVIGISRRRTTPDGRFDGIVHVSVPVTYLTEFWEQFAPTIAHVIPLVRADGRVIARYPALDNPETLATNGPFLGRALKTPSGVYTAVSQVDGVERLNAYTQVKDYPLFISFSVETHAILARWRQGMRLYGFYTLVAMGALVGMTVMAIRQERLQREAARRWQEQADRLTAEIAARETVEAALRQSQKMEAVGQLTGGMAHDFNNLLQAMSGCLQLIGRRAGHVAGVETVLDAGRQAVERGASLIRQLMAFSRRQSLQPEAFDIRDRLLGMRGFLDRALRADIQLEFDLQPGLWPAMADPVQFDLAVLNLATNARDAIAADGRVVIGAANVELADEEGLSGAFLRVWVRDSGHGIGPDTLHRVFEPFFTTKAVGEGTGLGLAQVYGFCRQSGGTATVESATGKGTTVSLLLPRAPFLTATPEEEPRPLLRDGGGARVLLVEDDPVVAPVIVAALEDLGYEVTRAASGEEALRYLERGGAADLLFTDVVMPGEINGIALARAARRHAPTLPVVLTTGYSEDRAGLEGLPVLPKPYRIEELAAVFRAELARRA